MSRPTQPVVVPEGVPGRTKAERVQAMFARIARSYDRMNRLMTFGLDGRWRRLAAELANARKGLALDVGCGTGDLSFALLNQGARRVVGVDFVGEMLAAARMKGARLGAAERVSFLRADALSLPFADATFDCVTNGFLLRNVSDLSAALAELARVLKPGGRLVCLEITHPPVTVAPLFRWYFGRLVPRLGALVSGHGAAYRYLPASLEPLPDPERLAALIKAAGLSEVDYRRVGFGTVAIHHARKAEA